MVDGNGYRDTQVVNMQRMRKCGAPISKWDKDHGGAQRRLWKPEEVYIAVRQYLLNAAGPLDTGAHRGWLFTQNQHKVKPAFRHGMGSHSWLHTWLRSYGQLMKGELVFFKGVVPVRSTSGWSMNIWTALIGLRSFFKEYVKLKGGKRVRGWGGLGVGGGVRGEYDQSTLHGFLNKLKLY